MALKCFSVMLGLSANIRINRSFVSRENVIAHHAINRDLISQARIDIVAKFPRVRYMHEANFYRTTSRIPPEKAKAMTKTERGSRRKMAAAG